MKRKLSYFIFLFVVFAAACEQSANETLQTQLKAAASWAATARLASEAWAKGDVPDAYARRALETSAKNLRETAETIERAKEIPADRKAQAAKQISDLQQTLSEIQTIIERGDQQMLAQNLERLKRQQETLASFIKSGEGGGQ